MQLTDTNGDLNKNAYAFVTRKNAQSKDGKWISKKDDKVENETQSTPVLHSQLIPVLNSQIPISNLHSQQLRNSNLHLWSIN